MSTTWEQLEGAALSLARSGSIKDRLVDAYRNHLAQVNVEDLPDTLRAPFRACFDALTRERPLQGEDAVRATVRKLSSHEAEELACSVVRLYGAFAREHVSTLMTSGAASIPANVRVMKNVPQVIALYAHETARGATGEVSRA
ncbi:MAG: hypothetical protein JOZ67_09970 [Gammaproteobacteria bacterium]|nr:hypothetical protein [Gammaproteobacteria bacterium]MBV9696164.1 hypothetical protein [Gammaproteobacteria bacterium]